MKSKITKGYKLFRLRKDGTLGPLFINAKQRLPLNKWLKAEAHLTKGYAFRPGWHAVMRCEAPHLSKKGRIWCEVELKDVKLFERPQSQGGIWYLAEYMKIIRVLDNGLFKNRKAEI